MQYSFLVTSGECCLGLVKSTNRYKAKRKVLKMGLPSPSLYFEDLETRRMRNLDNVENIDYNEDIDAEMYDCKKENCNLCADCYFSEEKAVKFLSKKI